MGRWEGRGARKKKGRATLWAVVSRPSFFHSPTRGPCGPTISDSFLNVPASRIASSAASRSWVRVSAAGSGKGARAPGGGVAGGAGQHCEVVCEVWECACVGGRESAAGAAAKETSSQTEIDPHTQFAFRVAASSLSAHPSLVSHDGGTSPSPGGEPCMSTPVCACARRGAHPQGAPHRAWLVQTRSRFARFASIRPSPAGRRLLRPPRGGPLPVSPAEVARRARGRGRPRRRRRERGERGGGRR